MQLIRALTVRERKTVTIKRGGRMRTKETDKSLEPADRDVLDAATDIYDTFFTAETTYNEPVQGSEGQKMAAYVDWYRNLEDSGALTKISHSYIDPKPGTANGFLLKQPLPSKRTAIVVHGAWSHHRNVGPWVMAFYNMGFNVFTPDLRGHGSNIIPEVPLTQQDRNMGIYDSRDLISWIDKIKEITSTDQEIVLHGYSLGASTSLQATLYTGLLPNNALAIVEDCGYADLGASILYEIKQNHPDVDALSVFAQVDTMLYERQAARMADGLSMSDLKDGMLPLLVIHGTNDAGLASSTDIIYKTYGGSPKDRLEVQGAGHAESIAYGFYTYREQIRHLLGQAKVMPCELVFDADPSKELEPFPQFPGRLSAKVTVGRGDTLPTSMTFKIVDDDKTGVSFSGGRTEGTVRISPTGIATLPILSFTKATGRFSIVASVVILRQLGFGQPLQIVVNEICMFSTPTS
ncbi:alpha/beta hydrolase [Trinickia sp. EG282A]|uniref:alpha/beta hydrolase n=1 Tax=Trinickia sp. EG282A TaxID=3237013 RepID=UPI0034D388F7